MSYRVKEDRHTQGTPNMQQPFMQPPPPARVPSGNYPPYNPEYYSQQGYQQGPQPIRSTQSYNPPPPPPYGGSQPYGSSQSFNPTSQPFGGPPPSFNPPPPSYGGAQSYNPPPPYGGPRPYGSSQPYNAPPPPGAYNAQQNQPLNWQTQSTQNPIKTQFFSDLKRNLIRDYVIVVDKSGSMLGKRWEDCKNAVAKIADEVCKVDPDGVTVCFFSTYGDHRKYDNITNGQQVMRLFDGISPHGTTDLGGILKILLDEHFNPQRVKGGYPPGHAPTTMLVFTDGLPDDSNEVTQLLITASKCILKDEELSISFIQIGEDDEAARYLNFLDDKLVSCGAAFDIVDALTKERMASMSFPDLIYHSIYD